MARNPQFISIVLSPIHLEGLRIPDTFMRKHGRELTNIVFLKDPTGVSWEVELSHYGDGRTMWEKRWVEFAEYYSIRKFFLLLFRYKGNSHFNVFIFNYPTCMEIEYPVLIKNTGDGPSRVEEVIEILDEFLPAPASSSRKIMFERSKGKKNEEGRSRQKMIKKGAGSPCKTVRDKSRFESYEKAKAFTSSNPFFVSFMQPSFVCKKFYLEIPQEFVKRYLFVKNRIHDYYTLRVLGNTKSWDIRVFFPHHEIPKGRIVVGWKEFVQDHCLCVGDVCVFELIPGTKNMNVKIYYSS